MNDVLRTSRKRPSYGFPTLTDGPFIETKKHIGGFYIIDAPNLDVALAWASKVTDATDTPIEVRPFMDVPNR